MIAFIKCIERLDLLIVQLFDKSKIKINKSYFPYSIYTLQRQPLITMLILYILMLTIKLLITYIVYFIRI